MGSSEITFISGDKRIILTVTYKGGGGGSILFHQASWDPIFLADIDPEASIDLSQLLSDKVCVHSRLHLARCSCCWDGLKLESHPRILMCGARQPCYNGRLQALCG